MWILDGWTVIFQTPKYVFTFENHGYEKVLTQDQKENILRHQVK